MRSMIVLPCQWLRCALRAFEGIVKGGLNLGACNLLPLRAWKGFNSPRRDQLRKSLSCCAKIPWWHPIPQFKAGLYLLLVAGKVTRKRRVSNELTQLVERSQACVTVS